MFLITEDCVQPLHLLLEDLKRTRHPLDYNQMNQELGHLVETDIKTVEVAKQKLHELEVTWRQSFIQIGLQEKTGKAEFTQAFTILERQNATFSEQESYRQDLVLPPQDINAYETAIPSPIELLRISPALI